MPEFSDSEPVFVFGDPQKRLSDDRDSESAFECMNPIGFLKEHEDSVKISLADLFLGNFPTFNVLSTLIESLLPLVNKATCFWFSKIVRNRNSTTVGCHPF